MVYHYLCITNEYLGQRSLPGAIQAIWRILENGDTLLYVYRSLDGPSRFVYAICNWFVVAMRALIIIAMSNL